MKPLVLSCLFTTCPLKARVYHAPRSDAWDCHFFSSSRVVGDIAERAGWTYKPAYTPTLDGEISASLAAKQVKFLNLLPSPLNGTSQHSEYTHIIYHDHKIRIEQHHVRQLLSLMDRYPEKHVFNFETPRYKCSVFEELAAAAQQQRYLTNMGPLLDFIGDMLLSEFVQAAHRITRTTVLAYRNSPEARQFLAQVHYACLALNQPECQIFWSAYSQHKNDLIHTEPWSSSIWHPPDWKAPELGAGEHSEGALNIEEVKLHSGEIILSFSDDLITTQIRRWGGHTRPEYAFATRNLGPGSRVFDLGAHIGTFALAANLAMRHRGLVLAVEGNPQIFRLLRDNLSNCPSAISINCYVGTGGESICIDDASLLCLPGNSMGTKAVLADAQSTALGPITATRSLDDLVKTFFAPDLIKLDLEGLEGRTLMSSSFIKERRPDLYFEVCENHQQHFGSSVEELMNYLRNIGYKFTANFGERNASHDAYVCGEVSNPASFKDFWDVYCSVGE